MKNENCRLYWKQANSGCCIAEVTINTNEIVSPKSQKKLENIYDYIVLKILVACFKKHKIATNKQHTFIETQMSVQKIEKLEY